MSRLITMPNPHPMLFETGQGKQAPASSLEGLCDDHESLNIPNRGIVLATLISSVLWAALILAAREAWLFLH